MTELPLASFLDALLQSLPSAALGPGVFGPSADPDDFYAAYAGLGWRLRRATRVFAAAEYALLERSGIPVPERLSLTELTRAALLCRKLAATPPERHLPMLRELFRTGDNAERETVLKTLVLLPVPERFLDIALDACRSSVQTTVEAITLDNAYPHRCFAPEAYRGMALKALHLGLPLARIHRLAEHLDDELARMAEAYASERRAAGRSVPADIVLLTRRSSAPCP